MSEPFFDDEIEEATPFRFDDGLGNLLEPSALITPEPVVPPPELEPAQDPITGIPNPLRPVITATPEQQQQFRQDKESILTRFPNFSPGPEHDPVFQEPFVGFDDEQPATPTPTATPGDFDPPAAPEFDDTDPGDVGPVGTFMNYWNAFNLSAENTFFDQGDIFLENIGDSVRDFGRLPGGEPLPSAIETLEQDQAGPIEGLTGLARDKFEIIDDFFNSVGNSIGLEADLRQKRREAEVRAIQPEGLPGEVIVAAGGSVGASASALAMSLITRNPFIAAAPMSYIVGMDSENRALEAGVSKRNAAAYGFFDGIVELGLGAIPLGILMKSGSGRKELAKTIAKFILLEEATEVPTTILQSFNAHVVLSPDQSLGDWIDQVKDEIVITLLSVPIGGGVQATAFKAVQEGIPAVLDLTARTNTALLGSETRATMFPPEVMEAIKERLQADETLEEKIRELSLFDEETQAQVAILRKEQGELSKLPVAEGLDISTTMSGRNEADIGLGASLLRHVDIPDTMTDGQVVIDQESFRNRQRGAMVNNIDLLTKERADAKAKGFPVTVLDNALTKSRARLAAFDKRQTNKRKALEAAKKTIEAINANLNNKVITILSTEDVFSKLDPGQEGKVFGSNFVRTIPSGQVVSIIELNTTTFTDILGKLGLPTNLAESGPFVDTLLHEYGHALWNQEALNLPTAMRELILREFIKRRTERMDSMTLAEMLILEKGQESGPIQVAARGEFTRIPLEQAFKDIAQEGQYLTSLNEYIANQISSFFTSRTSDLTEVQAGFEVVAKKLKRLHTLGQDTFGLSESMSTFMKRVMKVGEVAAAQESVELAKKRQKETMERLAASPDVALMGRRMGGMIDKLFPERELKFKKSMARDIDKFNWYINQTWGLLQMAQVNGHIPGMKPFEGAGRDLWALKTFWTTKAQDLLRGWTAQVRFHAQRRAQWNSFVFQADAKSDELGRALTVEEELELISDGGLNSLREEDLVQIRKMWDLNRAAITAVEDVLVADALHIEDLSEQEKQLAKIRSDFAKMRDRNYMPHTRFGKYTVWVRANAITEFQGTSYGEGETILFETFESERLQKRREKALNRSASAAVSVSASILDDDTVRMFQGLQGPIIDALTARLNLTPEQLEQVQLLKLERSPGQTFRAHLLARKGTPGFSLDAQRVFADYYLRFSNHIARITFDPAMQDAIQTMEASKNAMIGENSTKRGKILNWVRETREYINNPGNELAQLRAIGFIFFLGYVPKSAALNLTQIPLVTYPHLAARFGDIAATTELAAVMKDIGAKWTRNKVLSPAEEEMVITLRRRGILEESAATELAGTSEGSLLQRYAGEEFLGSEKVAWGLRRASEGAAWMFKQTEMFNREVTARAAFRLRLKAGGNVGEALEFAHRAVEQTQFEYARFNRPKLLRGKKSVFFLFFNYITNMTFFIGNDPGKWRYIGLLLFASGLNGLPYSENIQDIVDFFMTKFKGKMGLKNPKFTMRDQLRQVIQQLEDIGLPVPDLDTVLHGAARDLGPWDMSTSIGMGNILPTAGLRGEATASERLGRTFESAGGAVPGIMVNFLLAVGSDEADVWKKWERALPNAAKSISKSFRFAQTSVEKTKSGAIVHRFTDSVWDKFAIAGQAGGFSISDLNRSQEERFYARDVVKYYVGRRAILMAELDHAIAFGSGDAVGDVMEKIHTFNDSVPYGTLKLTPDDLRGSIKARRRNSAMSELNIEPRRRYRALYQEQLEDFPEDLVP